MKHIIIDIEENMSAAFKLHHNSKFALLAIKNVYTAIPDSHFQLSDSTWILPRVPVPDLRVWREWIGSIRTEQLDRANLVLLVEEESNSPKILDGVHKRLRTELSQLFYLLHLRRGMECEGADLLVGSSEQGRPGIRQMSPIDKFHLSKGYRRLPITQEWLEEAVRLRSGVMAMEADESQFRRVIRGLNTLFKGLQGTGQDRLHQFVRSLEALILPKAGETKKQFAHRCQTFAKPSDDTRLLLQEAFDMRSDTEHLNDWNRAVKGYPPAEQENICWHRTRQLEWLACNAYTRVLLSNSVREHFKTEAAMATFWKLSDDQRRGIWGNPIDLSTEPRFTNYDQWERGVS